MAATTSGSLSSISEQAYVNVNPKSGSHLPANTRRSHAMKTYHAVNKANPLKP